MNFLPILSPILNVIMKPRAMLAEKTAERIATADALGSNLLRTNGDRGHNKLIIIHHIIVVPLKITNDLFFRRVLIGTAFLFDFVLLVSERVKITIAARAKNKAPTKTITLYFVSNSVFLKGIKSVIKPNISSKTEDVRVPIMLSLLITFILVFFVVMSPIRAFQEGITILIPKE